MRRGLRWVVVLGLGGAFVGGCTPRPGNESGRFNEPIKQKYQSPASSESQPGAGMGGSGSGGSSQGEVWAPRSLEQGSSDSSTRPPEDSGPYLMDRKQSVPRERGVAPFGVGAGTDTSRRMAQEQLKTE